MVRTRGSRARVSVRDRDAVGYKEQLTIFYNLVEQLCFYYWFIPGGYYSQLGVSEQLREKSLNALGTRKH